jgi:hypothetical protein
MSETEPGPTGESQPIAMAARLLLRGWEHADVVVAVRVHFGLDDPAVERVVDDAEREVLGTR